MQTGDQLVITFNENLAPATVPATFAGATESRASTSAHALLTIPGVTNGALDTGSAGYLSGSGSKTATFAGTVALSNNGASTTMTLTITSVSGDPTSASSGALIFQAAPTITSMDGTVAAGTFTTSGGFKLF